MKTITVNSETAYQEVNVADISYRIPFVDIDTKHTDVVVKQLTGQAQQPVTEVLIHKVARKQRYAIAVVFADATIAYVASGLNDEGRVDIIQEQPVSKKVLSSKIDKRVSVLFQLTLNRKRPRGQHKIAPDWITLPIDRNATLITGVSYLSPKGRRTGSIPFRLYQPDGAQPVVQGVMVDVAKIPRGQHNIRVEYEVSETYVPNIGVTVESHLYVDFDFREESATAEEHEFTSQLARLFGKGDALAASATENDRQGILGDLAVAAEEVRRVVRHAVLTNGTQDLRQAGWDIVQSVHSRADEKDLRQVFGRLLGTVLGFNTFDHTTCIRYDTEYHVEIVNDHFVIHVEFSLPQAAGEILFDCTMYNPKE